MPRKKIDAVIEAVRYLPDGRIAVVRAYEARGAIWSDHILLDRSELVERLKKGKTILTGQRKAYFGTSLQTGTPVKFERDFVTTGSIAGQRDQLNGVPVF
jgi:hypothetical protein